MAEIERLVGAQPFAQLVTATDGQLVCTPLPLLMERDGDATVLLGHFGRANPQVGMLRRNPRALAVFLGAHGYISPSWMRDRTQAPTWNYETVHFEVDVTFDDRSQATADALDRLVCHLEAGRPNEWFTHDMGSRYARLAEAVIAFRARVVAIHAKFKLGQNERDDVYYDILGGLDATGQTALRAAMQRASRRRIAPESP
jgi:transcriptional regulator